MSDAIVRSGSGALATGGGVCPVCSTPVVPGRDRCAGCGKYVGNAEPCPHCNQPAPAVPYLSRSGAGCMNIALYGLGGLPGVAYRKAHENELVCELCGKHRGFVSGPLELAAALGPGGVPVAPDQAIRKAEQMETLAQGRGFGLKALAAIFGVGSAAVLLFSIFFFDAAVLTALGVLSSLIGGLTSLGLFVAARGLRKAALNDAEMTRLRALADLAKRHHGVLTLDQAAKALRLPASKVEPLLTAVVDHDRIEMDVDGDGTLTYRFLDWMPPKELPPGDDPKA